MKVVNKTMYHFCKENKHSNLWEIGNTIDNTSSLFICELQENLNELSYNDVLDHDILPIDEIIDFYIGKKLSNDVIIKLLKLSSSYIHNLLINQREQALEEVRRTYYPDKISRKNTIWVCDKLQLDYWQNELENDRKLFKVSVTGTMFVSSSEFLPTLGLSYNDSMEKAHEYWNPDFDKCSENTLEYLTKGKIKILKRIDRA